MHALRDYYCTQRKLTNSTVLSVGLVLSNRVLLWPFNQDAYLTRSCRGQRRPEERLRSISVWRPRTSPRIESERPSCDCSAPETGSSSRFDRCSTQWYQRAPTMPHLDLHRHAKCGAQGRCRSYGQKHHNRLDTRDSGSERHRIGSSLLGFHAREIHS